MAKEPQTNGPIFEFNAHSPLQALIGGLQLGQPQGRHQDRIIDCFDLIYVCQGTLPIQEEERSYQVTAPQTLLLWPHRHHWGTADFSSDLRLCWLHFTLGEKNEPTETETEDLLSLPQLADVMRPDVLEPLFRRFLDDQSSGRITPHTANLLLQLMLCEIADQRPIEFPQENAGGSEALAERTLACIRAYFHMPMTVTQLSKHLGYNADYLNRVFRQTYQRTLLEEINRTRVDNARHLLAHTSKNIAEITRDCGFSDVNYFSRLFKRHQGVTPIAFRRLEQAEQNKLDARTESRAEN